VTDEENYLQTENARLRSLLRQAGLDAAAGEVAQNLQKLMLGEMHHRIKNILAMVQSIASQSLRSANTLDEARDAINQRIFALSRTHDILLSSEGDASRLRTLLESASEPFGGSQRFHVDVPDVEITSAAAISISLVLNELCTNAVKYGALSSPSGRVNLTGSFDEATRTLTLVWVESGGPAVPQPTRRSFGTQLIEAAIPGESRLEFRPGGLWCEMQVSLPLAQG
jgi:two-component sensor histidine kinase